MLTLTILSVISPIRIFLCYKKCMALKLSFISGKLWKMLISSFLIITSNISKNVCKKFHAFGRKCAICQNFDTIPAKYLHKFAIIFQHFFIIWYLYWSFLLTIAYRYAFQVDNTWIFYSEWILGIAFTIKMLYIYGSNYYNSTALVNVNSIMFFKIFFILIYLFYVSVYTKVYVNKIRTYYTNVLLPNFALNL